MVNYVFLAASLLDLLQESAFRVRRTLGRRPPRRGFSIPGPVEKAYATGLLVLGLLTGFLLPASAQEYASSVVSYSNLSTNPLYDNPNAALGQPATLINGVLDDPPGTYHVSMVYPPYNTDPNGNNVLVTLGNGDTPGTLTLAFSTPIVHSANHWYGDDLIVFGNPFFSANGSVTPTTDMSQLDISGSSIYQNGTPTVSVSADGVNFTTLTPNGIWYPTNAYQWSGITASNPSGWGTLSDFTKPVNPALTTADFAGQSVAYAANTLYAGSAGGEAFSIADTPYASTGITYIQFTGFGNIAGVAAVGFVPSPNAGSVYLLCSLSAYAALKRRSSRSNKISCLSKGEHRQ